MAQLINRIRDILSSPVIYNFFQNLVGARRFREIYISRYVRPQYSEKILDIGCGTSGILEFLPNSVDYVGFDLSPDYLAAAESRYRDRGEWYCASVADMCVDSFGTFDIVMANGLLHHLDDMEATKLSRIAAKALKLGGRFCTHDGCFTDDQSWMARHIIASDRGRNIRRPEAYLALVSPHFSSVDLWVRHDMLRIPYTHAIMVATKGNPV